MDGIVSSGRFGGEQPRFIVAETIGWLNKKCRFATRLRRRPHNKERRRESDGTHRVSEGRLECRPAGGEPRLMAGRRL